MAGVSGGAHVSEGTPHVLAPLSGTPDVACGPGRRRVCIIGNSSVGAVYRAYAEGLVACPHHHLAFFARGGQSFDAIGLQGAMLTGFQVTSGDSADLRDYAEVVITADMQTPLQARDLLRDMEAAGYTARVRAAALRDRVSASRAMGLAACIARAFSGPIRVMSSTIHAGQRIGGIAELDAAAALVAAAALPFTYVPPPSALFGADGTVRPDYHSNSLNIAGLEPDRTLQPKHHERHYNLAGGALVLEHLLARLAPVQEGAKLASSSSSQAISAADGVTGDAGPAADVFAFAPKK
jgi:hypothetical protein